MGLFRNFVVIVASTAAGLGAVSPAAAQSNRTYVSSNGDDANPCVEGAPCRTFAAAILQTSPGGVVNCVDPSGYGPATITKALTIDCRFPEGGVLASGTGISVSAGASDMVVIRGLDVHGIAGTGSGIQVASAGSVFVENCVVSHFDAANAWGIQVQSSGAVNLYVLDSTVSGNGSGTTGGGMVLRPTGSGSLRATLTRVRFLQNAGVGLFTDASGGTGYVSFVGDDVTISGPGNGLQITAPSTGGSVYGVVNHAIISNHVGSAIIADGAKANLRVSGSTIALNGAYGVQLLNGGRVASLGDNHLGWNTTDGAFVATLAKQ